MCVQGVQLRVHDTSLWGSCIDGEEEEVWLPTHTTGGLPVRNLKIQLHRVELSPRSSSFMTSLEGIIVLNAEL